MEKRRAVAFIFLLYTTTRIVEGESCGKGTEPLGKEQTAPNTWNTFPERLNCAKNIDAAIAMTDGKTMFFQERWYWAMNIDGTVIDGYPRPIAEDWPDLPLDFDTALSLWDNRIFFFKGDNYWLYEGMKLQPGYPKKIKDGFCGVPDNLTSAVYWPPTLNMYFFKGNQVWKFDGKKPAYPKAVSAEWTNLPDNMEAAMTWYNGLLYFFKGGRYWAYEADGVDKSKYYPKMIYPTWGESCPGINVRIEELKKEFNKG